MKTAVVSRNLKIDPFSLSATAAEPLTGVASTALSFFLLGASGRTGLPFLSQALARGHFVTIYVRDVSKLPTVAVSHPHLRAFTDELHEADKVSRLPPASQLLLSVCSLLRSWSPKPGSAPYSARSVRHVQMHDVT